MECFANCGCQDWLLFVTLFKQAVHVPHAWIGATPSLRKRCRSIKGSAGRKRLRLIAERQCDEKVIDSKVMYLQGSRQSPASPPEISIPSPVLPTSSSSESEDDDFVNVKVHMVSWAAQGISVLTKYVVRRSSCSPGGRGSPAAQRDCPSRQLVSLLFVPRQPLVDRQANHRRRQRLRNGVQQQNHWYAHASFFCGARTDSPEMTLFPTLPGRKLARPTSRRLRNGLRDVEVATLARPSPSSRPQTTRFAPPPFRISRKFRSFFPQPPAEIGLLRTSDFLKITGTILV
jgi:hypothetical protein